jgi:hypothetical protein
VIAGMTKVIESVFVQNPLGLGVGVYAIYDWGKFNPKYLTGILNSKYLSYYLNVKFKDKHLAGGYLAINKSTLEKLPLVFSDHQDKIADIVDYIQFMKGINGGCLEISNFFERLIDFIVYELYFPEEMQSANCEVLKHLNCIQKLNDGWSNKVKIATIEKVYGELSDPLNILINIMARILDISEIKIVEGIGNGGANEKS